MAVSVRTARGFQRQQTRVNGQRNVKGTSQGLQPFLPDFPLRAEQ